MLTITLFFIEPRSIKIIERTIIPVIKVSTKDSRSRSLHLDISFDSQGHHGLESVDMVARTLEVSSSFCIIRSYFHCVHSQLFQTKSFD